MKYAKINSTNSGLQQVAGWFDADALDYPSEDFTSSDFVKMTDAQWADRFDKPNYSPSTGKFTATAPPPTLAEAKDAQRQKIDAAYANALAQPQSFTTAAGKTAKFTPDKKTRDYLLECELGFRNKKATPSEFTFEAHDGTEIPFAYADLLGLAEVLVTYGNTQYRNWKSKIKAIDAVTTSTSSPIKTVQSITW